MNKSSEHLCILLIADQQPDVKNFRSALFGLNLKKRLTVVTTLQRALQHISKNKCDLMFCNYMQTDQVGLDFFQKVQKTNTSTAIVVITDSKSTAEQSDHIRKKHIHRVDRSLITSDGLKYLITMETRHAYLNQKIKTIEKNIAPMMEYLPIFVFFIDRQGIIRYAKGRLLESLELPDYGSYLNKSIYKVVKPYPYFATHIESVFLGKEIKGIDVLIKNTIFDVSYIPATNKQGYVEGVYGIVKDCTKHTFNRKNFLKAKKEIEQNALLKEQFSANISHEIRTPMNAIVGFSNLLAEERLTKRQLLYVKAIKQSSENLLVIINDVLDFSKAGAKKLKLNRMPFNLRESIKILETTIMLQLNSKKLFLVIDVDDLVPEYLVGDTVRVSQILLNLLINAVKFTDKGGIYLSVCVKRVTPDQTTLLFRVKDTGIGIPKSEQKNIFKRFAQVQTENTYLTRHGGGTGLGLAICKHLANLQKGSIGVESMPNRGSTFFVELPFGQEIPLTVTRKKKTHSAKNTSFLQKKRVLLVEDNSMNKILTEIYLKSWGMWVDIASNGQLAVEKVRKKYYDIVLMDIQMPVLNGIDATRTIRFTHSKDDLPIVAMTAHALPLEQKKCREAGMNNYIIKPYKVEEVRTLIINLLKEKSNEYTNAL